MNSTTMKPTVQRRRLAAKLRNLRTEAGISPERIMDELDWSRSKLSRIETASNRISVPDVRALCTIYGVGTDLAEGLCAMSKQARRRGWWHEYEDALADYYSDYLELESEASTITTFQIDQVPGLFQTEEYAAASIRAWVPELDEQHVHRRVEVRMARQARINDGTGMWAILDESVLARNWAEAPAMRAQLTRLAEIAELPNVTMQILPLHTGMHAAMSTPFTFLEFESLYDPVVYTDHLTGAHYLEDLAEVDHYRMAAKHLRTGALDQPDSVRMLERYAARMDR